MNRLSKPNIIYILADDLGYGDISALNPRSKLHTTHIDNLCRNGLTYTDAHSTASVCTPSRYSLLTGYYNWRSSLKSGVLFGYDKPIIHKDTLTLGTMLQAQGYKTACIGKWHLGLDWTTINESKESVDFSKPIYNGPTTLGFDYFYGISASLDMAPYVYIENDRVTTIPKATSEGKENLAFWRKGPIGTDFKHIEVLPNCTRKVIETIDEFKDEPFFIYFPLPAPHTPVLPTNTFVGKSNTNAYGDFVLMCDDVVGQITAKLEAENLLENTMVVFASDNGFAPCVNQQELIDLGHNPSYIFRGTKSDIYEGGHRIPYIVQWPKKIKGNRVYDKTVCLVDFMATIAEVLDVKLESTQGIDSVSHRNLWYDENIDESIRNSTIHHSVDGSFSIRKGKWKLELCSHSGGWSSPTLEESEGLPKYQLYNLEEDIRETTNLYEAEKTIAKQLRDELINIIFDKNASECSKRTWSQLERILDVF